jgi:hypothetical protein
MKLMILPCPASEVLLAELDAQLELPPAGEPRRVSGELHPRNAVEYPSDRR